MKECPNCHKLNSDDQIFCGYCGNELSEDMPKYLPGFEPKNIKEHLDLFFEDIDNVFPNKQIIWSEWNHERWDSVANALCKALNYKHGKDFLEVYGYTIVMSKLEDNTSTTVKNKISNDKGCHYEYSSTNNSEYHNKTTVGDRNINKLKRVFDIKPDLKKKLLLIGVTSLIAIATIMIISIPNANTEISTSPTYNSAIVLNENSVTGADFKYTLEEFVANYNELVLADLTSEHGEKLGKELSQFSTIELADFVFVGTNDEGYDCYEYDYPHLGTGTKLVVAIVLCINPNNSKISLVSYYYDENIPHYGNELWIQNVTKTRVRYVFGAVGLKNPISDYLEIALSMEDYVYYNGGVIFYLQSPQGSDGTTCVNYNAEAAAEDYYYLTKDGKDTPYPKVIVQNTEESEIDFTDTRKISTAVSVVSPSPTNNSSSHITLPSKENTETEIIPDAYESFCGTWYGTANDGTNRIVKLTIDAVINEQISGIISFGPGQFNWYSTIDSSGNVYDDIGYGNAAGDISFSMRLDENGDQFIRLHAQETYNGTESQKGLSCYTGEILLTRINGGDMPTNTQDETQHDTTGNDSETNVKYSHANAETTDEVNTDHLNQSIWADEITPEVSVCNYEKLKNDWNNATNNITYNRDPINDYTGADLDTSATISAHINSLGVDISLERYYDYTFFHFTADSMTRGLQCEQLCYDAIATVAGDVATDRSFLRDFESNWTDDGGNYYKECSYYGYYITITMNGEKCDMIGYKTTE